MTEYEGEYIKKYDALKICDDAYRERVRMQDWCGDTVAWNIAGDIKKLPAADVVPVVRCHDCELWEAYTDHNGDEGLGWCENGCGDTTHAMFFCASGKRKEGDKNEKESDL